MEAVIYKSNYDEEVSAKALVAGQTVKVDSFTLALPGFNFAVPYPPGVLSTKVPFLPKKSFKVPHLKKLVI